MTPEQQMKAALDGNFWYFTHDGKIECRKVGANHIPMHHVNEYRTPQVKKPPRPLKPANPNRWSWQDSQWLKANYRQKSIGECVAELNKPYSTVYKKIVALRWKEWDGRK